MVDALGEFEDDHVPRHVLEIAVFDISCSPATNAEYACFVAAGGYDDKRWWEGEAAQAWWRGEGTAFGIHAQIRIQLAYYRAHPGYIEQLHESGRWEDEVYERSRRRLAMSQEALEAHLREMYPGGRETEPRYWQERRVNNPAQPVVGVSWFEARAYCAWLSAQTGEAWRLPSEVEWEAAVRGIAGRPYAYGKRFDSAQGNTVETRLMRPTPVGVFVEGDTPDGLTDMGGNVAQWTLSLWGQDPNRAEYRYPYVSSDGREDIDVPPGAARVVRGGSWFYGRRSAHAAWRSGSYPDYRFSDGIGFRPVRVVWVGRGSPPISSKH